MKNIKTVILCGGRGYRLKEETEFKPKPMIEIGGQPILWHIMNVYAHWGFKDFIVALGYKGNLIKDYFVNKKYYDGDFTLHSGLSKFKHHSKKIKDDFRITFVDTGIESLTGERVRRIKNYIDGDTFMITYGDGVADINIRDLFKFHSSKRVLATITGIYPLLRYGGVDTDKRGLAAKYEKKAKLRQAINGGFMVFSRKVFDYLKPNSMIEEVLPILIEKKKLAVYEHKGFWQAMDTYQDMDELNTLWENNPPWKIWV